MNAFYNKTILVTGHMGFKGSWLALWLAKMGANVVGVSLPAPTSPSNFIASSVAEHITSIELDILKIDDLKVVFEKHMPDYVFHLAAQALVRESYDNPLVTFNSNAIGTINVLEALRLLNKNTVAVMITSDKVYQNKEWHWGYRENDEIGGDDPYSASKGMAELAIHSYIESYFRHVDNIKLAIARAGNVIGGGDWAADRIIPDAIRAWTAGEALSIRSPNSTRPWQHVFEPLRGYLKLALALTNDPCVNYEAFNFGPRAENDYSVKELIDAFSLGFGGKGWNDISSESSSKKEAGLLKLSYDKALRVLDWAPSLDFRQTLMLTSDWYREFYSGQNDMYSFSISQIDQYMKLIQDEI